MEIGTILNEHYQIRSQLSRKLGRSTWLADDLSTQHPVIIKLLRFHEEFQWDDLKLFEREAATLKHLDRPEIPKYLDYFDLPDGFVLVQTYIDAPALATLIQAGRKFSEAEIIELAERLLDILTYLHQQNPPVIHRDIKPSNILLGNRSAHSIGDVYLVDFGSVQTVASKQEGSITIVGSYGYIPLEQFEGRTTPASDLYSLGMTLIYLLTGIHPIELGKVDGRVQFSAEISSHLKRWLEKMTHPHLDKRFEGAKIARLALNSKDSSYSDLLQLKPHNTKIKLYRKKDKLEIIWRDIDRINKPTSDEPSELGLLLIWLPLGWILCLLAGWYAFSILLFFLICLASFILYILEKRSAVEFDYTLAIDKLYVAMLVDGEQVPMILFKQKRSEIKALIYNPSCSFNQFLDKDGNIITRGEYTVNTSPELKIYFRDYVYTASKYFSQTELLWLGQELSDFLNLELQVIHPTHTLPTLTRGTFCYGSGMFIEEDIVTKKDGYKVTGTSKVHVRNNKK